MPKILNGVQMPKFEWISKALVLGSGAIKIGEAGEFDYSGSQCLKALREEGIETVLVNPNIATIQTDPRLAGKVYLLPVLPQYIKEVIERERPDGILLSFGGQTALNCGVQLSKMGILDKYGIKVLGTPIKTIEEADNRELFRQAMLRIGIPIPKSKSAFSMQEAVEAGREVGYPVIVRVSYALGGRGSGTAFSEDELKSMVERSLAQSMINQVLIEEYIGHWKEIEFEVMRDYANNCLTTCSMENLDPMGVHTGDSIVIAPAQTLNRNEYQMLRSASIKVIQGIGVVGECNIQWALHPRSLEYRCIEVNTRMSRSSALASKATGYPLAYIAAKLAIGYLLTELINKVTGTTTTCFEPTVDYVVIKFPRWDLQKFRNVDRNIGPQMKSVGEVMAIGRSFEEALQKSVRMLDIGKVGLVGNPEDDEAEGIEDIKRVLANPTDERLFKIVKALKIGISVEEIYKLSGVDPWFLYKIDDIIQMENKLRSLTLKDDGAAETIREAKALGFSDTQIANYLNWDEASIRNFRKKLGITPVVKQVDTVAAEWASKTNYLYLTYGGQEDDIEFNGGKSKIIVLGSGVFRIGSSVEFDWCAVNTVWSAKRYGVDESIMINYNPETVSTDFDVTDKLYFEELTLERILDIYEKEKPLGVVVSVGGQIPNSIAMSLSKHGVNILGTSAESIDRAEDRSKFSTLLDNLGIPQPKWSKLTTISDAEKFASGIGYPVLVRPSYVLSGSAMRVAYAESELKDYLELAAKVSKDHPVVISKFIQGAREVEVDGISDGKDVIVGAVIEHVERAGVHSGDATFSVPTQDLNPKMVKTIEDYTNKIAKSLEIKGPFNIQYLVKDGVVYVIECNLRASRSLPFVSKTRGVNLIDLATAAMLGKSFRELGVTQLPPIPHVGVKVPQFSFMRLSGADPVLGVEMLSTGEAASLGESFYDALIKALQAAEFNVPMEGGAVLITVGGRELQHRTMPLAKALRKLGFKIYATEHTAEALKASGLSDVTVLYKVRETDKHPNILDHLLNRKIQLVINIPAIDGTEEYTNIREDEYVIRRLAVEFNIPVVTTLELATALVRAISKTAGGKLTIRSLNEYMDGLIWKRW